MALSLRWVTLRPAGTDRERRQPDHLAHPPVEVTQSGTSLFHLNFSQLPDSWTHPYSTAAQTDISVKGTWFLNNMNQISFISPCASPYFKKETYWLVNPEYVSIVWQRFIRTKVSDWLGLHPGALFPFEHAAVSSGEQVQNGSLGEERESRISDLNHLYTDHKMTA